MSRFGFLARKPAPAEKPVTPAEQAATGENPLELDEELFSTLGAQLGGENEALRNMLLDANNKIAELDTIKAAVGKLVDPVSKALRDFETEKTEKVGLQTVLNNTRTAYGKLRNEVGDLEKKLTGIRARMPDAAPGSRRHAEPAAHAGNGEDGFLHRPCRRARAYRRSGIESWRSAPANAPPCATRTAASTNGWSPPKDARSRSNPISAPRASGC